MLKPKKRGSGLEIKSFQDEDGNSYIVHRYTTSSGANSYHVFTEVEAKQVALLLGETNLSNTANAWNKLWDGHDANN